MVQNKDDSIISSRAQKYHWQECRQRDLKSICYSQKYRFTGEKNHETYLHIFTFFDIYILYDDRHGHSKLQTGCSEQRDI